MKNREIFLSTIIVALIGGVVLYVSLNNNQTTFVVKNNNTSIIKEGATTQIVKKPTITKIVAPDGPVNVPAVIQPATTATYTLSNLSQHNNETSCWTAINGKIYDITPFISSHPAGVSAIMKGCGVDATRIYDRVGAHDISQLSSAFVGNLK